MKIPPSIVRISINQFISDNVCIDAMSVKINRRMMENSSTNIQLLEKTVQE